MAVLAHYLNGDFIPWYLTCCQATSCYIQLFWVAEGNFRIQFRLSLEAVGIAACNVFTWKHTQHLFFFFFLFKNKNNPFKSLCYKQALLTPLLSSLSQLATMLIMRGEHHLQNELPCRCSESVTKCQTSLHGRSFTCLIARSCSWKFPGADRKNNFEVVFDRPAGRLCK